MADSISRGVRTGRQVLASLVLACSSGLAAAAYYGATGNVVIQGVVADSDGAGGSDPGASASVYVSDPASGRDAKAGASSSQGQVMANGAAGSGTGKASALGEAWATYDDVIVTWTGEGDPGASVINLGLNFALMASQSASGSIGTTPYNNIRSAEYAVSVGSATMGGEVLFRPTGSTGLEHLGAHTLFSEVQVGASFTVSLYLNAGASASRQGASPVRVSMNAALNVTSSMVSEGQLLTGPDLARFDQGGLGDTPVFELPPGYTVNSVSMGVVDNQWIYAPVPEPATWLSLAAGLGLLLVRHRSPRRRACAA